MPSRIPGQRQWDPTSDGTLDAEAISGRVTAALRNAAGWFVWWSPHVR
jgi:hypothetical protein